MGLCSDKSASETPGLATGDRHTVTNPRLSETEMLEVQDEVFQVLGWS